MSNPTLSFSNKDKLLISSTITRNEKSVFVDKESDEAKDFFNNSHFVNFKRHEEKGVLETDGFSIEDSILIKGDNLRAMNELLKTHEGQVKAMYWDILYNTNNKGLSYNDCFSHSDWLVMMKNRLDVAKQLLKNDGVICLQCDDNEMHYLKVLCDEIFGRNNFINQITIKVKSSAGFKTVNKGTMEVSEYILFYAKNKKNVDIKKIFVETPYDTNYSQVVLNPNDNPDNWVFSDITTEVLKDLKYDIENLPKETRKVVLSKLKEEYTFQNPDKVFQATSIGKDAGIGTIEAKEKSKNDNKVYLVDTKKGVRYIYKGRQVSFYKNKIKQINGKNVSAEQLTNIWTDIRWEGIAKEGGVELKKGKKPERLIERILELSTDEGDIVLDAFLGAGTTSAVAHKMNRKFIGIEALEENYQKAKDRMDGVLSGENTGISKAVGWQGGGSFISCELNT